jgi:hypothetical protein
MQIPQSVRDLVATGPLAHLTTINPDGSPEVTVVWVGIDKNNDNNNDNDSDELVIGHLGPWKKVQNTSLDGIQMRGNRPSTDPPARAQKSTGSGLAWLGRHLQAHVPQLA